MFYFNLTRETVNVSGGMKFPVNSSGGTKISLTKTEYEWVELRLDLFFVMVLKYGL